MRIFISFRNCSALSHLLFWLSCLGQMMGAAPTSGWLSHRSLGGPLPFLGRGLPANLPALLCWGYREWGSCLSHQPFGIPAGGDGGFLKRAGCPAVSRCPLFTPHRPSTLPAARGFAGTHREELPGVLSSQHLLRESVNSCFTIAWVFPAAQKNRPKKKKEKKNFPFPLGLDLTATSTETAL